MLFKFACPKCASRVEADAQWSGSFADCPHCGTSVNVPPPRIGPDTTLGGFRLERLLGRGGMGEVYLATQLSMDRQVAVKILPPALTTDRAFVDRFLLEVRTAAKLEHPNIVTAFDAGEDAGTYYLAMGYVEGESLEEKLKRDGPFREQDVLRIALKLSKALGYAWEHFGILHRDIKPANIMLDRFGEVKLMDLGVAKMVGEETSLTITGVALGTPTHMSPEQARGASDMDCRSDIYSLACCMFHLLTGHAPYLGKNPLEVMNQHLTAPVPTVRGERPEVSAACEALVVGAMQKDRRRRPRSWAVMAAQIEAVLSGHSLPPSRAVPAPRTWLVVGALVLVLALLVELLSIWLLADRRRIDALMALLPGPRAVPTASVAGADAGTSPVAPAPAVSRSAAAVSAAMERIADLILARKLQEAHEAWAGERVRLTPIVGAARVEELDPVVTSAIHLPERLMASFAADVGKEVTIGLRDGQRTDRRTLIVQTVQDLQVQGVSRTGDAEEKVSFHLRQLSLDEQLQRLKPEAVPNLELCRGVVYLGFGELVQASASFGRARHPLADAFLVVLERRRSALAQALPRAERRLRDWFQPRRPAPRQGPAPPAAGRGGAGQ